MKSLAHYATLFSERYKQLASGHRVYYREANPSGVQTYIVVHGLTGTHYSMLQMAGVWAERGIHVITLDMPGHGKTDRIVVEHFSHLADWLHEAIDTIYPTGDYVLIGNSFGSSVCLAYAQKYGLRGESSLLLGAPIPQVNAMLRPLERLSTVLPDSLVLRIYYKNNLIEYVRMKILLRDMKRSHIKERLRESLRSEAQLVQHRYAFNTLMPTLYDANPFNNQLSPDIIRRTIAVTGSKDRIAGRATYTALCTLLPADRVFVGDSGHLVHIEALVELDAALSRLTNRA